MTASDDGATVTAPVSLYEWFRVFYSSLEAPELRGAPVHLRPREAVLHAGELLFVPRGWWHTALNLQPTVAITQNYVPVSSAAHVLRYLDPATARELVSGVAPTQRAQLHAQFLHVLRRHCPEALQQPPSAAAAAASPASPAATWWDKLVEEPAAEGGGSGGGFKFGFS